MRTSRLAALALSCAAAVSVPLSATAASTYIGLGDSITFGETDLSYVPSFGDRGYVGAFADVLAGRSGGVRPEVVNLAIDGETTSSFINGFGRMPPVVGRTDPILAAQNANSSLASQYSAAFVDTAMPFVGREAEYTYIDEQPAGSDIAPPFGGLLPLGNVHPNGLGYQAIAGRVAAVPEPASVLLMGLGGVLLLGWALRRNKARATRHD